MDYLPYFLKHRNLDLQPSNSKQIDTKLAKDILYPSAHIATSNPYEHFHHGIGPEKTQGRIQITTLPIFLAGEIEQVGKQIRQLYLINYENDTPEKQEATS